MAQIWQVITGMAVVTYVPRLLPMLVLTGRKMPQVVERWLGYIPVAILGALLCASLAPRPGELALGGFDLQYLLASIPAAMVAMRWRNILLTVSVGLVAAMLVRLMLP